MTLRQALIQFSTPKRRNVMQMNTLKDLYIEQLRDLYSAESQLVEALPKMAEAASHDELRQSFEMHLEQTKRQRDDVASIIQKLGAKPDGHECQAMKGLIKEGQELLEKKDDTDPDVLDAGLIAAAQRVEHYEIAGYGTVRIYARTLGEKEAEAILHRIAGEEGATDQKLTALAESVVNSDAMN
jgi:ferritin-like metal-binding protein YciE